MNNELKGVLEDNSFNVKVQITESGPRGKEGKSAYETWLDLGNEGTEQEYLASLKGDDGHTPIKGTDYWTTADQASIVADVLAALPVYDGSVIVV